MRVYARFVLGALVGSLGASAQQQAQDRAALYAARAITQPALRVSALLKVAADFPGTAIAHQAQGLALDTDLQSFPEHTEEIHALAAADLQGTPAGFERWAEQSRLADMLANAGEHGADLADAKPWAQEAVTATTEESYRRQMAAMRAKYQLDRLTPRQLHINFTRDRASFLAALANVDLRLGNFAAAQQALAEAKTLSPLSSEVSSLEGQLALEHKDETAALHDFERAETEGDLQPRWRMTMLSLYQQLHHGDEAELQRAIDALYAQLFPPSFLLPPRSLPPGGHTVLLELFTGSGCEPCVAPDLAVESLLKTYTRQDLVVLEWDEHIPKPDPLANPDSAARAVYDHVGTTPEAFLDGEELPVVGASRTDVENVVVSFADEVEQQAAQPGPLHLQLQVTSATHGALTATLALAEVPTQPAAPLPARAAVHFALVQDAVRYSGENGIRFHRMVVRSVLDGSPLQLEDGKGTQTASFHPAQIATDQTAYLARFAEENDRFGQVHFLTTDIPFDPGHLAVVAWVEDPATHHVLGTVYAAVP